MKLVLALIAITCECLLWRLTTSNEEIRETGNVQTPGGWHTRSRAHVDEILVEATKNEHEDKKTSKKILSQLIDIYHKKIRPVEKQFYYTELGRHVMTDSDIYSNPICLVVGPWSTGKSTMINFILGIEGTLQGLYTGVEPTTSDFTALTHGREYKSIEGIVMATDAAKPFSATEKFGQNFLERLQGVEMPNEILERMTFIDTPGILENRKQQERGYPYNDVMRWMVNRADLIFVVFDPTKLDIGYELESLFQQLKGKESQLRIILNKADSVAADELMRVYGALFWSLAPLINVTEPPRIYVGSFWSQQFATKANEDLFLREEMSLLHDMGEVIRNRIANKIAYIRQHAIRVRIHALLVDSYVAAYRKNKGMFGTDDILAKDIVRNPGKYNIYKNILVHPNVSAYDLPSSAEYDNFFKLHPLTELKRISDYCSYLSGCATEKLEQAINHELPRMLKKYQESGTYEEDNGEDTTSCKKGKCPKKAQKASAIPEDNDEEPKKGTTKQSGKEATATTTHKAPKTAANGKTDAPKDAASSTKEQKIDNKKKTAKKPPTSNESKEHDDKTKPGLLTRLNNWLDSLTPPPTHEPKKKKKAVPIPEPDDGEPRSFLGSIFSHIYTGPKPGELSPRDRYRLPTLKQYDKTPLHLQEGGKGKVWKIAEFVGKVFGQNYKYYNDEGTVQQPKAEEKTTAGKLKPSKSAKMEEVEPEETKLEASQAKTTPKAKKATETTMQAPEPKKQTESQTKHPEVQKKPEAQQKKPEPRKQQESVRKQATKKDASETAGKSADTKKAGGKPAQKDQKPVLPSLSRKKDTTLLTSLLEFVVGEPNPNKITARERYRKNRTDLPPGFWEEQAQKKREDEEAAAARWRYFTTLGGLIDFGIGSEAGQSEERKITAYERYRKPRKDLPADFFEKLELNRQQEAAQPKISYLEQLSTMLTPKGGGPSAKEKYRKRRTDLPPEFWEKWERAQELKARQVGFFTKMARQLGGLISSLDPGTKGISARCKYRKDIPGCPSPEELATAESSEEDSSKTSDDSETPKQKKQRTKEQLATAENDEDQQLNFSGILKSIAHVIQLATVGESDRPCNPWHKSCQQAQGIEGTKKKLAPVVQTPPPPSKKPCKPRPKPDQATAAGTQTSNKKQSGSTEDGKRNKKNSAKNTPS